MPWRTPIDQVFNQKTLFYAFVGLIVGTTVLTLVSDSPIGKRHAKDGTVFDPTSKDPENWSINDLKKWLRQRDIHFERAELRDALVQRVQEAIKAGERREQADSEIYTHDATEQIEMDDLGNRKTTN